MLNTNSLSLASASSQYVYHANAAAFQITGDMTLELWVKHSTLPSNGNYMAFFCRDDNLNRAYTFEMRNNAGTYELEFNIAGTYVRQAYTIATGEWHHIAVSYTASSGTAKYYLDGSQVGSDATGYPTSIPNVTPTLYIGTFRAGSDLYDGLVDELRIWSVVRTQAQIAANKGVELVGNESGLNFYGKVDGNYNDSTSNGNTLSTSGSPTFSIDVPFAGTADSSVTNNNLSLLGVGV